MALIDRQDRIYLKKRFAEEMEREVVIEFFSHRKYHTAEAEERFDAKSKDPNVAIGKACRFTWDLYQELAELTPQLKLKFHDLDTIKGQDAALNAGLDGFMLPTTLYRAEGLAGQSRFFGIPGGYEFGSMVETIIDLSKNRTDLSETTRKALAELKQPMQIVVFVTPTCPYCPSAARMAHHLAMVSPFITADTVEANEFGELAERYEVDGVPKTVINDKVEFEGAIPEALFLNQLLRAVEIEQEVS
jgi:glutaredoxin-like protein